MAEAKQILATQMAGQAGASQKAMSVVTLVRTRFMAMPARHRTGLMAGLTLLLAVAVGMSWYAARPDWRVLFSGLESRDLQTVTQELAAAGIRYQPTVDGSGVEVPAELLDKARMEVAAKGMPQTGRLGFELFDKPNWVGSEFDERVNYQRALEGELEHTIATLGSVRSARVHLVLPQPSMFLAEEKTAKASVVLKLRKSSLSADEIASIRGLVSGAVENLQPAAVTLVDADGRVDLQDNTHASNEGDEARAMEARLIAMLEPLAGAGNVRATVNLTVDQGTEEHTDEVYDPAQSAALTTQKEEQTGGAAAAQGIPGTASNTPAAAPAGAAQGSAQAAAPGVPPLLDKSLPVYPHAGGQAQMRKEESGTFAVSKHTSHTEEGPGRVRRVSAAVVVNDRPVTEGSGKTEHTAWHTRSPEEMHRLETLAQAAVGYDDKRGDQVVLQNVSFSSNVPDAHAAGSAQMLEEAKSALRSQPGLLKSALFAAVGLVLIWFVLRPVATQMVATLKEPALLETTSIREVKTTDDQSAAIEGTQAAGALAEPLPDVPLRKPALSGAHLVHDQISEHIRREPAQSTRLLAAWIGANDEEELA